MTVDEVGLGLKKKDENLLWLPQSNPAGLTSLAAQCNPLGELLQSHPCLSPIFRDVNSIGVRWGPDTCRFVKAPQVGTNEQPFADHCAGEWTLCRNN